MDYHKKYLKYKVKYLNLLEQKGGVDDEKPYLPMEMRIQILKQMAGLRCRDIVWARAAIPTEAELNEFDLYLKPLLLKLGESQSLYYNDEIIKPLKFKYPELFNDERIISYETLHRFKNNLSWDEFTKVCEMANLKKNAQLYELKEDSPDLDKIDFRKRVKSLIDDNISINQLLFWFSNDGEIYRTRWTLLTYLIEQRRDESKVHELIKLGVDVNQPDGEGNSPLMVAVARRFPRRGSGQPIVELLLKNGADPNYVNTQMPSGKPKT